MFLRLKALVFNADSFFDKLCKNLIIENVHKHFCKFLLEVAKRGSNIAVVDVIIKQCF
jgi:hypothetical protein